MGGQEGGQVGWPWNPLGFSVNVVIRVRVRIKFRGGHDFTGVAKIMNWDGRVGHGVD